MKKLNEQLTIDEWKKIAEKISKLKIIDHTEKEFKNNLIILKNLLSDLDLCLELGNTNPKIESQIGLSTLLDQIDKTSTQKFCEYIYILNDLGIQYINYNPINFPKNIDSKLIFIDGDNHSNIKIINKCYTDGNFKLSKPKNIISYIDNRCLIINDLKNASYILLGKIFHERPYALKAANVYEARAIIKNFNGKLPHKNEFISTNFPILNLNSQKVKWGESPEYTMSFNEFKKEDISYTKRLENKN